MLQYLLLLLFPLIILAQEPNNQSISGTLIDVDNKGVPFANISITDLNAPDKLMGNTSDINGKFSINIAPNSYYRLQITCLGYKSYTLDNIFVENKGIDLGYISLETTTEQIDEVTVIAEAPEMRTEYGRTIWSMGGTNTEGSSALEAMENIPSLSSEGDQGLSMRGSKVTILVDGVVSDLGTMLDQIPANLISEVEVIPNPSAKYDNPGGGPIINIKMKENRLKGARAWAAVGGGTAERVYTNGGFNLQKNKLSIGSNFSYRSNTQENILHTYRETDEDKGTKVLDEHKKTEANNSAGIFRTTVNKRINRQSRLSGELFFTSRDNENIQSFYNNNYNTDYELYKHAYNTSTNKNKNKLLESTFRYRNKAKDESKQLDLLLKYNWNIPNKTMDRISMEIDPRVDTTWSKQITQVQDENQKQHKISLKADFSINLTKLFQFEFGYLSRWEIYHQDLKGSKVKTELPYANNVLENDTILGDYQSNAYRHEGYMVLNSSIGKLSISGGARGQYIYTKMVDDSTTVNKELIISPSFGANYEINKALGWDINFSQQQKAPSTNQTSTVVVSYSDYYSRTGNPDLKTQKNRSIESGVRYFKKSINLNITGYWRQQADLIGSYQQIYEEGDNTITVATFENLGNLNRTGVDLQVVYKPSKKFRVQPSAHIEKLRLSGPYFSPTLKHKAWIGGTKLRIKYKPTKKWSASSTFNYWSNQHNTSGWRSSKYQLNGDISYRFLDNKLNLKLTGYDLLDSRSQTIKNTQRIDQRTTTEIDPNVRYIQLSLSYRFAKITQ